MIPYNKHSFTESPANTGGRDSVAISRSSIIPMFTGIAAKRTLDCSYFLPVYLEPGIFTISYPEIIHPPNFLGQDNKINFSQVTRKFMDHYDWTGIFSGRFLFVVLMKIFYRNSAAKKGDIIIKLFKKNHKLVLRTIKPVALQKILFLKKNMGCAVEPFLQKTGMVHGPIGYMNMLLK